MKPPIKSLHLIACISQDLGLGSQGQLLWHLQPDMAFFRETTLGHPVIMGSKTYRSIGHPLPHRQNIVLSHQDNFSPDVQVYHNAFDLDDYLTNLSGPKFIIGGASLYQYYLESAEKLYLTEVDATKSADTFFPAFDKTRYLRKVLQAGEQDGIKYEIVEYTRL